MHERLDRICIKLRAKNTALCPPLSEEEVVAFEASHHVQLPAGYRDFLIQIANGCTGPPHYGLLPLGATCDAPSKEEREFWRTLPDIAKPFPFTHQWVWEADEETDEGTQENLSYGTIHLGTDGCGMNWHLVVTGPDRGVPWLMTGEGIGPISPKRDFLQWFEDWLDGKKHF